MPEDHMPVPARTELTNSPPSESPDTKAIVNTKLRRRVMPMMLNLMFLTELIQHIGHGLKGYLIRGHKTLLIRAGTQPSLSQHSGQFAETQPSPRF
jgi:hypothetical protein